LLELQVRISPGEWVSVFSEYCVLSGRGFCDCSITCPEESYESEMFECDRETSTMRRPRPTKALKPRNKYIDKGLR